MEHCVFCWLFFCLHIQDQTCWPVDLFCSPFCAFFLFHCPYLGSSSSNILFSQFPNLLFQILLFLLSDLIQFLLLDSKCLANFRVDKLAETVDISLPININS